MPRSDEVRLRHMLDAASAAVRQAGVRKRSDLETDELFRNGIAYMLLVLGEAAAKVSAETRGRHPEIAWRQITGLRNHLVHGYDDIDPDIIWQVVADRLPPLIVELERILATKE